MIEPDGSINRGAQKLPGNWSSTSLNLSHEIAACIGRIVGAEPAIMLHNAAVLKARSEIPVLKDVDSWAVLTIGTGLGNASFRNRQDDARPKQAGWGPNSQA
ncbi:hypothetical protein [Prosthecomicrobium sp. N25]|uniref:hypothetical protein n=1 Tax=Prosthecomicrobium sp. N25 TaxID=3129254 RepID=UPI0030785EB9